MKWINRERPKIDRITCPWLIARFIVATVLALNLAAAHAASVLDTAIIEQLIGIKGSFTKQKMFSRYPTHAATSKSKLTNGLCRPLWVSRHGLPLPRLIMDKR